MLDLAPIMTLDEFEPLRPRLGKIVATCGGYDPIHPGHISCLLEARKLGDSLVVLVNGDGFLQDKKGRAFQDVQTRCRIVAAIRGVDAVIPFEIPGDPTMIEALRRLRPAVFAKGGDRTDASNIPEWGVCQECSIRIVTGVGCRKDWSSSDFLKEWGEWWKNRKS